MQNPLLVTTANTPAPSGQAAGKQNTPAASAPFNQFLSREMGTRQPAAAKTETRAAVRQPNQQQPAQAAKNGAQQTAQNAGAARQTAQANQASQTNQANQAEASQPAQAEAPAQQEVADAAGNGAAKDPSSKGTAASDTAETAAAEQPAVNDALAAANVPVDLVALVAS
ncbi:MAG TPA: hypothetical protein VIT92_06250, partial [Burkholderiaceae bacterium]